MKNQDYFSALKDFEEVISKNQNLKDAYLNAGVAYSKINELKKSANSLIIKVVGLKNNLNRSPITTLEITIGTKKVVWNILQPKGFKFKIKAIAKAVKKIILTAQNTKSRLFWRAVEKNLSLNNLK